MASSKHLSTISFMEYDAPSFSFGSFFKTALVLFIVFTFLIMAPISFLTHFTVFGFVPHVVLFLYILIHIFEKPTSGLGTVSALVAGILLDLYSSKPFGFYTALLSAGSLAITIIKSYYVRFPHF